MAERAVADHPCEFRLQPVNDVMHLLVSDHRGIEACVSHEEESDVEHELIRGSLAQVTQLVDAPGFRSAVEMLAAGITLHIADEEQTILPELLREMRPEEQSALGDALVRARGTGDRLQRWLPTASSELPPANAFNAGR